MSRLLAEGIRGIISYAKEQKLEIDLSKHHSACGVCREIVDKTLQLSRQCE
jgi:hypothetical protein